MPSILKLDSILLTLLSTVIRVSFLLSLSQKGICSSIVYHKTLHLYYKFSYYEERTYNLLRYHYHFIVTTRYISGAYHSDLPLYTTVIRYFAILYEVFSVNVKCLPSLINQALQPFSSPYFSSTTWKMKNFKYITVIARIYWICGMHYAYLHHLYTTFAIPYKNATPLHL